jgi:hypothetical protein
MWKLTWPALTAGISILAGAAFLAGVASSYGPPAQTALTAETIHGCLSNDRITEVALDSAVTCQHGSVPVEWRGPAGSTLPSPGVTATRSATVATFYGCLSDGWVTNVALDSVVTCQHGSRPIHWRGHRGGTLPSPSPGPASTAPSSDPPSSPSSAPSSPSPAPSTPSPAPSTPSPAPSSSSPSPSPTGTPCVSSDAEGTCGPYLYPQITGSNGSNTYVLNDVWSPIAGWSQTLTSYGPGDFQAVVNMPAGNTAVVSYPDVQQLYSDIPLSTYTSMTSSVTENMNATSSTIGEAGWDVWMNNWNTEVMIWIDNHNQDLATSGDTYLGTTVIGGQNWDVYRNGPAGGEMIVALDHNEQTGTVDIMATLNYLEQQGWIPSSNNTLTAVDFGAEFCSTGGQNETFQVSSYAINAG